MCLLRVEDMALSSSCTPRLPLLPLAGVTDRTTEFQQSQSVGEIFPAHGALIPNQEPHHTL